MYIRGLVIGDEVAAFDGKKLIGALKIKSENVFDNSLAIFSTLTNEKGYSAGNQIKLKVWSENKIVSADFYMEAIFNSYVSDMYPYEDGKYSIVNIKKASLISDEKILVFPNPAIENISIVSQNEISKISIFNCFGQLVYENIINDFDVKININNLESGAYIIKIETAKGMETHRVAIK